MYVSTLNLGQLDSLMLERCACNLENRSLNPAHGGLLLGV